MYLKISQCLPWHLLDFESTKGREGGDDVAWRDGFASFTSQSPVPNPWVHFREALNVTLAAYPDHTVGPWNNLTSSREATGEQIRFWFLSSDALFSSNSTSSVQVPNSYLPPAPTNLNIISNPVSTNPTSNAAAKATISASSSTPPNQSSLYQCPSVLMWVECWTLKRMPGIMLVSSLSSELSLFIIPSLDHHHGSSLVLCLSRTLHCAQGGLL